MRTDLLREEIAVALAELQDVPSGIRRGAADLDDAAQEEAHPPLPVPIGPDRLEAVVVLGAVRLQVDREVEKRAAEDAALAEEQGDQQAPDAAVSVEEGVDSLKLRVGEPALV